MSQRKYIKETCLPVVKKKFVEITGVKVNRKHSTMARAVLKHYGLRQVPGVSLVKQAYLAALGKPLQSHHVHSQKKTDIEIKRSGDGEAPPVQPVYKVASIEGRGWCVVSCDGWVIESGLGHREAWKAADRLNNEHESRAQETSDWLFSKRANGG